MENIIVTVVLGLVALGCFVISFFQFKQKGFLFNNAYIYASEKERETMDKKPHYIQTGVIFVFIGLIFTVNAINVLLKKNFLLFVVIGIAVMAIIYAIVSSVLIERRKK